MTQVKEEKSEGLKHNFTMTVPSSEIQALITKRLEAIAKKAKIQGFRPGKAPMDLIRQRFGAEAEGEVVDKLIDDTVRQELSSRKLRPAMQPQVDGIEYAPGKDLSFKLAVEILPEIKPMDFGKLSFEKQVADVTEKTVDEAIERIAKSMRQPEAIEGKRAAKKGDVAVIDFDGSVDGKAHPGMKGEGHNLELGSNAFIPGFEEQVVGMKAGDKKDIKVTFPEGYHAKELSGKEAVFAVSLKEIREHKPVAIDDELSKEIGFPSLEKLRERIKGDIGANYEKVSRTVLKRELMDSLAKEHKFDLPASMADGEFNAIWSQLQKDKAEGRLDAEDAKKSDEALKKEYRAIAERRVRLGLLLAHVAEEEKIEVAQVELQRAIMNEARRFPGQEKAVMEYFMKNRQAIEQIRAPLLEEKVVDFILSKAKISEKKIDAEKLLKMPEDMD